jgi:hypothetical protein
MLKRIEVFTRFLDDGRICLSNNAASLGCSRRSHVRVQPAVSRTAPSKLPAPKASPQQCATVFA